MVIVSGAFVGLKVLKKSNMQESKPELERALQGFPFPNKPWGHSSSPGQWAGLSYRAGQGPLLTVVIGRPSFWPLQGLQNSAEMEEA